MIPSCSAGSGEEFYVGIERFVATENTEGKIIRTYCWKGFLVIYKSA